MGEELLAKSTVNPAVMQMVTGLTVPTLLDEEIVQLPVVEGSLLCGKSLRDVPALGWSATVVL